VRPARTGNANTVVALGSLLVILALGLIIVRVATAILEATGMSEQAARFQARSAFTSSGFTTRESESVVEHPIRRKVVMWLMLLGNAGLVAAAGSLIVGFHGSGSDSWRILELAVILLAFVFVSRSRWIDRRMTSGIARVLNRFTDLPERDADSLIQLAGGYSVSELAVQDGDWIAGRTLADTVLRDEGVIVLGVRRDSGRYLGLPTGDTRVDVGDTLIVYGASKALDELDRRPAGELGNRQHRLAARRHRMHLEEERGEDEAGKDAELSYRTGAPNRSAPA